MKHIRYTIMEHLVQKWKDGKIKSWEFLRLIVPILQESDDENIISY